MRDAANPGPGPVPAWNAADLLALSLDLGGALEREAWLCREPRVEWPQRLPASQPKSERRAAAEVLSPLYASSLTSSLADLVPLLELPENRTPRKRNGASWPG